MSGSTSSKVAKLPLILLGVMTLLSFGGPFLLLFVLEGGAKPGWPPDRPVEWWTLVGICGLVAGLMVVLLVLNLRVRKSIRLEVERLKTTSRGDS